MSLEKYWNKTFFKYGTIWLYSKCTWWTGTITSSKLPVGQQMLTLTEHLVDMKYYFYHYTCWTGNDNPSGTPGGQEILPLPIHLLDRKSRPFRNTWWTKILTLPKHLMQLPGFIRSNNRVPGIISMYSIFASLFRWHRSFHLVILYFITPEFVYSTFDLRILARFVASLLNLWHSIIASIIGLRYPTFDSLLELGYDLASFFFLFFFFIISILHLWTIYLWVPGNLKGLQIFTMNNIIK